MPCPSCYLRDCMQRALCAVALLALACLLLRAARVGLAGDYVDPIGKITAQDEALYANSAIRMARQGNWLTPMFMGRLALYKPPLLMWAAGLSARPSSVRFSPRAERGPNRQEHFTCKSLCLVRVAVVEAVASLAAVEVEVVLNRRTSILLLF